MSSITDMTRKKRANSYKTKDKWLAFSRHLFLIILSLLLLIPFYICVVNAFKRREDILANPMSIPFTNLTFDNIIHSAITPSFNIFKAYATSMAVTGVSVVIIIIVSAMMSYVIARSHSKVIKFLYLSLLAGLMIPPQAILIPLVQLLSKLGLMFTPQGLILYYIGFYIPFSVFVYTGFIRTISVELDESARMDGANDFTIFWKVIFPLLKPSTATVCIFLFLWIWNDFVNPLIILGSTKYYTVTTGIYQAVGQYSTNWEQVFALVLWGSVPIFILYIYLQRFFISGLTEGSVKG